MVPRTLQPKLLALAAKFPAVTLTGPRQSGKTTLCRASFPDLRYVSLEAPDVREYATNDPRGFLADVTEGAILDEVQRVPDLLSYLQVEVDARPRPGRFVLTGSANFALLQSIGQSLAGRTAVLNLLPLGFDELRRFPAPPTDLFDVLWRGAFPAVFDHELAPYDWFSSYVGTYIERDVRQILNVTDLNAFQAFLRLCAGRIGGLLNLSALGADTGITHATARAWLSVLEASYVAHRLPTWASNVGKRVVKTPKLHFYDSGLACFLLGLRSPEQLRDHPLRGAIFETWVVSEILKARIHHGLPPALSFFRDRKGVEVDALVERGDVLLAVETKSGRTLADDFFAGLETFDRQLDTMRRAPRRRCVLVYGGDTEQHRTRVDVLPWSRIDSYDWCGIQPV
jgi:predicted AAA+ superfamily ATPase